MYERYNIEMIILWSNEMSLPLSYITGILSNNVIIYDNGTNILSILLIVCTNLVNLATNVISKH